MNIIGFSFIRNAVKFDYPFQESVRSLAGLCDKVVIAVGDNEDDTDQKVAELTKEVNLEHFSSVWDQNHRDGGKILSQQTNLALAKVRSQYKDGWAIYLQADEVIAEFEYEQIKADLQKAEAENCDAVRFRYLHFWQSPNDIAIDKRWYPQEIRAIRIDSSIESYGDAQSFKNHTKIFESDAHIFHYGHVREASAYESKKENFHRWWHKDDEIDAVISKGKRNDSSELCLHYLGPHALVMHKRLHLNTDWNTDRSILIYGNKIEPIPYGQIHAREIVWTQDLAEVQNKAIEDCVILTKISKLRHPIVSQRYKSSVPDAMHSPQARPWTEQFQLLLRLSERGIPVS